MNKIIKFSSLLLCACTLLLGLDSTARAQNNVTRLENGLRVLIVEDDRAPLVSVRLYVEAGGAYEESELAGISHVLEHMVFRGTKKYPDGTLANVIESAGGDFNAYTSSDETVYYCTLPAHEWKKGLDVVADMALYPVIDAKILEEEKEVIYAEMGQRREEPEMRIYEDTIALALAGTKYEHGVLGTKETVGSITVDDMNEYRAKFYNPQNMLLVVVGDINKDAVLEEAEKYFGERKNTSLTNAPSSIELPLYSESKLLIEEGTGSSVLINVAFPTPSSLADRAKALDVFGLMLGGLDTSILTKEFEIDDKLVNSINAYNIGYKQVSLFIVSADVEVDKVEEFWEKFVEVMAKLSIDDFSKEDLDTAKFLYEVSFQRRKSTIQGHASLVGGAEFDSSGEFSVDNYLNTIQNLSLESIFKEVDEWINPNNVSIAVLAPKSAIEGNKLPNFLASLNQEWQEEASIDIAKSVISKGELQKLLPKTATIEEMSEERIVINYAKGSKVILMPDNIMPFFTAGLTFVGGNSLLPYNEQGLSSLMANTLTEATKSKSKEEFAQYLTQKAISISANTSRENFTLALDAPTKFEEVAFKQFSDVLNKPAFSKKDFERIKEDTLISLRELDERADMRIFSEMSKTLFEGNAYEYSTIGTLKSVESFSVSDVKDLWKKQKEQAWIFAIAGDFNIEEVLEFINTLPINNSEFEPISTPNFRAEKENFIEMSKANHEYFLQLFKAVPYMHEDAAALRVLHGVLGDMSGILFKELREKQGLAYSTAPIAQFLPATGIFGFYINTAPENSEKILPAFAKVIEDLKEKPLPNAMLERAKKGIQTSHVSSMQSLDSRVREAINSAYLGRSYDFQQEFINDSLAVTPEEVQEVAKKYLNIDDSYLLWVGPQIQENALKGK